MNPRAAPHCDFFAVEFERLSIILLRKTVGKKNVVWRYPYRIISCQCEQFEDELVHQLQRGRTMQLSCIIYVYIYLKIAVIGLMVKILQCP